MGVYPVCLTEPVLGVLPSSTAAAEGLAETQLLFLPLAPGGAGGITWVLLRALASPPLQDRCSWVPAAGVQCVPPSPLCNGRSSQWNCNE